MNSEVATLDALRAQNIALQVQLSGQERELAQSRHALNIALAKAGSWGAIRHRVVLSKALNTVPLKAWPPRNGSIPDDSLRAQQTLSAFEAQVAHLQRALNESQSRVTSLDADLKSAREALANASSRHVEGDQSAGAKPPPPALVAHLMAQIKFLHSEVERLEKVAAEARDRGAQDANSAAGRFAKDLMARERVIEQLTSELNRQTHKQGSKVAAHASADEIAELQERVESLSADKSSLLVDKTELQGKLRKAEASLKATKSQLSDAKTLYDSMSGSADEQQRTLHAMISQLAKERDDCRAALDVHRLRSMRQLVSEQCQTEVLLTRESSTLATIETPETVTVSCQVNSVTALQLLDTEGASIASLTHALEVKCQELDSCRTKLADATEDLRFMTEKCGAVTMSLNDESLRRKEAETDCERLGIQVRALQQQSSQLQVHLRDREASVRTAESKMNEALAIAARAEEDRRAWEAQVANNAHDIDNLVAQQSLANHQVAAAASENEGLRAELQKLLHREAQLQYSLRAKEVELSEVVAAYQRNVQETEAAMSSLTTLERECDNLRSMLSARDERIVNCSEQIQSLHQREQQLMLDLQSVDYENGLLHRKLVTSENKAAQADARIVELSQQINAAQKVVQEFERSQTEMHKQLVVKENELMLLRQRCDIVTRDGAQASSAHHVAMRRVQELEDANARLAVRDIMSHVAQDTVDAASESVIQQLRDENSSLRDANSSLEHRLHQCTSTLREVSDALHAEQGLVQTLRDEVGDLAESRDALLASQRRLEALVQHQAETLAACDTA